MPDTHPAALPAPDGADRFPAPAYKDTVLAPLFEHAKRHHWRYLMRINRAHGTMLAECGWLTGNEAAAILDGLDGIEGALDLERLAYTGEHEDFYFYIDSELRRRVGGDVAGKLHTGRSRNDIDHTLFKMALRDRLAEYLQHLFGLLDVLVTVAERERATLVVAYTHGQPAQPTTFGHYLGALVEVLQRDVSRLLHAWGTVDLCSLGAAAITTSGFGLDRARVAALLGFGAVQDNAYGCIAACDYITEPYAALRLHFLNLGRFVQDLNTWTGFEVGHLHVPDGYVQISSIMPQKRNPVPVEHLRLLLSLAAGRCETVVATMHNTPFTDMNDAESEVQVAGYEAFDTGLRVLRLLGGFVAAVRVNDAQVRRHLDESCTTITELAESLVREEGITSHQAHGIASRLARRLVAEGETLASCPFPHFAAAFRDVVGRDPRTSEAEMRRYCTPEHFVAVRTMHGGPAPQPLDASLRRYRARLAEDRAALQARLDQDRDASDELARAGDRLRAAAGTAA